MENEKLSLCLIVKNEQKYLKRGIDSVREVVDEIVIVDTGSTDNTIEIASSLTKNVYQKKFDGDFSKSRNYAIIRDKCKS